MDVFTDFMPMWLEASWQNGLTENQIILSNFQTHSLASVLRGTQTSPFCSSSHPFSGTAKEEEAVCSTATVSCCYCWFMLRQLLISHTSAMPRKFWRCLNRPHCRLRRCAKEKLRMYLHGTRAPRNSLTSVRAIWLIIWGSCLHPYSWRHGVRCSSSH